MNFAVNVLGTYTMTESMLPLLEKAAPDARVITVSSGGMYTVPLTNDLMVTVLQHAICLSHSYDINSGFSLFSIRRVVLMGLNNMLETSVSRSVKLMTLNNFMLNSFSLSLND